MRSLLLAVAAILATATVASAEERNVPGAAEPNVCLEWPVAMGAARASNPDAALLKEIEGPLAKQLIDVVNKLPPTSQFDGDHAALFFKASADQFLVVIGKGECARTVVELPASIFAHMVGQPV